MAYALFAERGYDHVTVADICEAAEIAPRTFFRYFAGKEDVVAEPVRLLADEILDAISAAPAGRNDAEAVRWALRTVGGSIVAQRERLTVFLTIVRGTEHKGMSRLQPLGAQEREIGQRLVARRPGSGEPGWRLRVLVATALAAFRIWFEEVLTKDLEDPSGQLDDILAVAGLGREESSQRVEEPSRWAGPLGGGATTGRSHS